MLAMMIAGYMATQRGGGTTASSSGGGLGGLLGGLLGGTSGGGARDGLSSLLDMDGDGNPLDDILRMAR